MDNNSQFKLVFSDKIWSDKLYRFLQVIFHLYPEDQFHYLISEITKSGQTDEEIYTKIQNNLTTIKPFLSELTFALPALKKQKKEMSDQVLQLLGNRKQINGYLEIGSTGRYISELKKYIDLSGQIFLTNDIAPSNSIADIMERGQISKIGTFFFMHNYKEITAIAPESIDLVACHIGLHHCPLESLGGYIQSIHKVLRKGGQFIIRDHDVQTAEMATFVSLIHTIFNLGLNVNWETDRAEFRSFRSINEWSEILTSYGFKDSGKRILQDKDPSDNTLMSFTKL